MNQHPEEILNRMFQNDAFSQWMQMKKIAVGPGTCTLEMKVRKEMLNGFGIAHGGITYSLADSALAFASNSHNRRAVSVETSISHTASVYENDVLTACAEELSISNKIANYQIKITNQKNEIVALFKGTVYRTSKPWIEN